MISERTNNIIDPHNEPGHFVKKLNHHTLPNYYNTYFIDKDGTEIMTLDTFIKTEMARRNLNFVEFCEFIEISAPVMINLRKKRPTSYVYLKLSALLKINQEYLEKLPITELDLRNMYLNEYGTLE